MEPAPPSHAQTNAEPPKVPEQSTLAAQVTMPTEVRRARSRVPLVALSLVVLGGVFAAGYGLSRVSRNDGTQAGPTTTRNDASASTVPETRSTGSVALVAVTSDVARSSSVVAPSTSSAPMASAHVPPSAARVGLLPEPAPTGSDLAAGARCAQAAQCSSGFCVDGVCCATACTQKCFACSGLKVRGRRDTQQDGTCGFVEFGLDPDSECAGGLVCDGIGRCADRNSEPF
jgi:hypothetical protein